MGVIPPLASKLSVQMATTEPFLPNKSVSNGSKMDMNRYIHNCPVEGCSHRFLHRHEVYNHLRGYNPMYLLYHEHQEYASKFDITKNNLSTSQLVDERDQSDSSEDIPIVEIVKSHPGTPRYRIILY